MARPRKHTNIGRPTGQQVRAIGYVRVSTDEQAQSGLGLEAQRDAITAECKRKGWALEFAEDAGISGKTLKRPGITGALDRLARGEADVLVLAKLDRLSRTTSDVLAVMDRAQRQGFGLVFLDLAIDTTTPMGRMALTMMAAMAQWEREMIGVRTRDALAVKKAQGVQLGRPSTLDAATRRRISDMARAGVSANKIAQALESEGVKTAAGGRWHAQTVCRVLERG